jgi:integrase/recombinase XerC
LLQPNTNDFAERGLVLAPLTGYTGLMSTPERDGVSLTHLDEPLFDGAGATKRDLVDYLEAVAGSILPELRGRPLSVIRVRAGQRPFMQIILLEKPSDLGKRGEEPEMTAQEGSFPAVGESLPRSNAHRNNQGRNPVHATPDIAPSAQWLDAWDGMELRELSQQRSAATIRNRKCVVMIMARHFTAESITDPAKVTKAQLTAYLLRQYQDRKPGGRVAFFQTLRVFWDWLAAEYEVANPMAGIPRPKGGAEAVPVIRPEDIGAILTACKDRFPALTARNTAIVWLMVESGLRRFEVTKLNLADIDLKARTVTVRCGKGGKARVSVFGDEAGQAIWRYLRHRGRDDGPLFLSEHGGRLTPSGASQIIGRISRRSGVQVRPHMFRHTWAHANLAAGLPESSLCQLAGWSDMSMLRRYGAALAQERAIAAGRQVQVGQFMKAAR